MKRYYTYEVQETLEILFHNIVDISENPNYSDKARKQAARCGNEVLDLLNEIYIFGGLKSNEWAKAEDYVFNFKVYGERKPVTL